MLEFRRTPESVSAPPCSPMPTVSRPHLPTARCLSCIVLACILAFPSVGVAAESAWQPLFNGRDLTGWRALPGGKWFVLDGELIGISTRTENRHGLLLTERSFHDFDLRLKFRCLAGNSGLYFRVEKIDAPVGARGLQAEIAADGFVTGGLYETQGRQWVAKADPKLIEKIVKRDDWNEMEVRARGADVTVLVNGVVTVELKNDPGRRNGLIGLQLHGRMEMDVRFKDIAISESR